MRLPRGRVAPLDLLLIAPLVVRCVVEVPPCPFRPRWPDKTQYLSYLRPRRKRVILFFFIILLLKINTENYLLISTISIIVPLWALLAHRYYWTMALAHKQRGQPRVGMDGVSRPEHDCSAWVARWMQKTYGRGARTISGGWRGA